MKLLCLSSQSQKNPTERDHGIRLGSSDLPVRAHVDGRTADSPELHAHRADAHPAPGGHGNVALAHRRALRVQLRGALSGDPASGQAAIQGSPMSLAERLERLEDVLCTICGHLSCGCIARCSHEECDRPYDPTDTVGYCPQCIEELSNEKEP
jgi:hypothetical protein